MNLKRRIIITAIGSVFALTIATTVPASASSTPTQYFTASQSSLTGPQTIVAAGPISANGTDTQIGRRRDNFVFPDGTLTVRHEPLTQSQTYDSRTCVGTITETGTYVITHGTDAYAHVTGSGRYKVTGVIQSCAKDEPPTSASFIIEAHGPLTLG